MNHITKIKRTGKGASRQPTRDVLKRSGRKFQITTTPRIIAKIEIMIMLERLAVEPFRSLTLTG
jgi:hypothetical protein